jgi:EAL domain-containing protein (putative c-di-GMP-specific phosphodiesterase class I)
LQELGCDFGQGFFFGKPMSAAQLQDFIHRGGCDELLTQRAMAYANQWADRLPSMEDISGNPVADLT